MIIRSPIKNNDYFLKFITLFSKMFLKIKLGYWNNFKNILKNMKNHLFVGKLFVTFLLEVFLIETFYLKVFLG